MAMASEVRGTGWLGWLACRETFELKTSNIPKSTPKEEKRKSAKQPVKQLQRSSSEKRQARTA
jgi:hypothetical protein